MNKSQLIEALSNHFEGNKKSAQHALESVLDTITREVAKGEKVAITGFGAFEKAIRPSRMVRNPRTGERTRAKKTAVPKFRAGADLKAVVSGAKKLPKAAVATAAKATSTARRTATASAPAKKTTARKSTAKKTAAKKTAAKRTTTPKAATKKAAAKKLASKRTTASTKKAAAKTLAKKTTTKKATKRAAKKR
ncbi:MAG: HU family DNA-binding protein [Nocardioidaceae bacterium]